MAKDKKKYYSLKKILAKNATYNVIFGQRSNGKTYATLCYAVKKYFETGGQFSYIRRWKEDITGRRAQDVFTALNVNGVIEKYSNGKFTHIYYWAGKFYPATVDENGKFNYNNSIVFGYTFSLSDNEHNKSISYPLIQTILFDEFLTNRLYLNDEFVLFMNTISTIIRKRENVEIFMLGNTVNKYCPYFAEMGLNHITKMNQGTIDVYTYGKSKLTVAVEYCATLNSSEDNNFYFAFDNPKLKMITNGAWELDIYPHCPFKYERKDIKFIYFIRFDGYIYQCEIVIKDMLAFTFIHLKTTEIKNEDKDLIYDLEYNPKLNYSRNLLKPATKLQQNIVWFFRNDRVYYQDNNVGNAIANYIKICRSV